MSITTLTRPEVDTLPTHATGASAATCPTATPEAAVAVNRPTGAEADMLPPSLRRGDLPAGWPTRIDTLIATLSRADAATGLLTSTTVPLENLLTEVGEYRTGKPLEAAQVCLEVVRRTADLVGADPALVQWAAMQDITVREYRLELISVAGSALGSCYRQLPNGATQHLVDFLTEYSWTAPVDDVVEGWACLASAMGAAGTLALLDPQDWTQTRPLDRAAQQVLAELTCDDPEERRQAWTTFAPSWPGATFRRAEANIADLCALGHLVAQRVAGRMPGNVTYTRVVDVLAELLDLLTAQCEDCAAEIPPAAGAYFADVVTAVMAAYPQRTSLHARISDAFPDALESGPAAVEDTGCAAESVVASLTRHGCALAYVDSDEHARKLRTVVRSLARSKVSFRSFHVVELTGAVRVDFQATDRDIDATVGAGGNPGWLLELRGRNESELFGGWVS